MTIRDQEILEVLTHRLRVLSVNQLARTWWNGKPTSTRQRLSELEAKGWVTVSAALAQPAPDPLEPVASWAPDDRMPEFGKISYALKERWKLPLKRTTVVAATDRAAAASAGWGGRVPRVSELAHDLALAEVYLLFRRERPDRAKGWKGEASLYSQGFGRSDNLPDAMIVSRKEKTVIELGGAYGKDKLIEFHETCVARGFAYEIW